MIKKIKILKPTKRTITIKGIGRFFLEFPEIIQVGTDKYAIKLDGTFYYLPLPNIDRTNRICHGTSKKIDFWTSAFTRTYSKQPSFYKKWQKHGFKHIEKELVKMEDYASGPFIGFMSEEEQLKILKYHGHLIEYIHEPSEKVQMMAVANHKEYVKYIKNPSEKLQMLAVSQSGWTIKHIKNPSIKVQLAAIESYPLAIKYIKRPVNGIQLAAIAFNAETYKFINKPTKEATALYKKLSETININTKPSKSKNVNITKNRSIK